VTDARTVLVASTVTTRHVWHEPDPDDPTETICSITGAWRQRELPKLPERYDKCQRCEYGDGLHAGAGDELSRALWQADPDVLADGGALCDRPKTELIAECLDLAGYEAELGDGAREKLAKAQLVAIAKTLAVDRGWPAPEHALDELFDALTQRELRATIGWLVGFEYFDEVPESPADDQEFVRDGSGWFRRAEIVQIHDALEAIDHDHDRHD